MPTLREFVTKYVFDIEDEDLVRTERNFKRFRKNVENFGREGPWRDAAGRLRQANGRFISTGRKAGAAFGEGFGGGAQAGISGIASTLRGAALGIGASGLGVGSIFGLLGKSEETQIALETMIGDVQKAKATIGDLRSFAAATPFTFTGITDAATRLLAFNFKAEELIPNLEALGNIAAGVGKEKLPDLVRALGQVRAKGRLQGDEALQFMEAGVPIIVELAKLYGKSEAEVYRLMEARQISAADVQKALFAMSAEGGRFHKLMAKQSKSLPGIWSNITDTIQSMIVSLGERGLLAEAKKASNAVLAYLQINREMLIGRLNLAVKGAIGFLKRMFDVARGGARVFEALIGALGGGELGVSRLLAAIQLLIAANLLAGIGRVVQGLGLLGRAAFLAQLKMFAVPLAIGAALAAAFLIIEDLVGYFQGRDSLTGHILEQFGSIGGAIRAAFSGISEALAGATKYLKDNFAGWKEQAADFAKDMAKKLTDALFSIKESDVAKLGEILMRALDLALTAGGLALKMGMAIGAAIISGIEEAMREKAPALARLLFGEDAAQNAKLKALEEMRKAGKSTEEINAELMRIDAEEKKGFWGRNIEAIGKGALSMMGFDLEELAAGAREAATGQVSPERGIRGAFRGGAPSPALLKAIEEARKARSAVPRPDPETAALVRSVMSGSGVPVVAPPAAVVAAGAGGAGGASQSTSYGGPVSVNNTFNVSGARDPKAYGREVADELTLQLLKASADAKGGG